MQVALISIYETIVNYGLRCISSLLKQSGIPTRMIYLPRETEGYDQGRFQYKYDDSVLDEIVKLTQSCDLVGIGVMSNYFDSAVQITEYLRKRIPGKIIWGGIHASLKPDECLKYADLVCVGEGEYATLELVQQMAAGKSVERIANIWHKKDGQIVRNPVRLLENNLDNLPYPDYDINETFILHDNKLVPLTEELLMYFMSWPRQDNHGPNYLSMMSRGCTYSCTYCCNNALRNVYEKNWKVRRRSVPNFINELIQITRQYPNIRWITIDDDVFLSNGDQVKEFCELYKKHLSLPFAVTGFQPSMVDEEKIGLLVDAGMKRVRMGIQTGNIATLHNIYKRAGNQEQMLRAINVLHKFSDRIDPPIYDFIVDNPWESEEQEYETLKFMLKIPQPFSLAVYSLTFYPGTELYERAKKEGYLHRDKNEVYEKDYNLTGETYINSIVKLFRFHFLPHWVLALIINRNLHQKGLRWVPVVIYKICRLIELIGKGIRTAARGDWKTFERLVSQKLRSSALKKELGVKEKSMTQA